MARSLWAISGFGRRTSGTRQQWSDSLSLVARLYLLVALAVLPAIAIQIYNELTMRQQREAQVHDEALRLAEFAASDLKGVLAGAHTLLISLASAPAIRNHAPAACDSLLA